jgi:hypothetical protein
MKADKIVNYLRAGFSTFWLRTSEHDFVREKLYDTINNFERKDGGKYTIKEWSLSTGGNPNEALEVLDSADELTILFLYNWHWFADKPQIVQKIKDSSKIWSSQAKAIVCVSHTNKIPAELEKEFVLIDLPLPNGDEITQAISELTDEPLTEKEMAKVINGCKGLARTELDNVLALAAVENDGNGFSIETINEHKAQSIRKTGFLDVLDGDLTFDDVIGYDEIKRFVIETIDNPKAKGIMTIGPPGCGKTSLMKAIVGETGKFGLSVNMGSLFSKFQGETDRNINTAIEIISSVGDCLVLIDEFEKQFAGSQSDGSLDSGTTRRATGRWLDFLQNRPEGVYIVGTANSFNGIPNEYLRPGRWDSSPFFIDYPNKKVARKILRHYCDKEGVKPVASGLVLDDFSGAEIEALVHIASMRGIGLIKAAEAVIPQAKTSNESIAKLRNWAKGRTIPAEQVLETRSVKRIKTRKIDK